MKASIPVLLGIFLTCAAANAFAAPTLVSNPTPTRLEGWCNNNGGTYSPPNSSGYYACIFPDGTVVACGGSISGCDTITPAFLPPTKLPMDIINVSLQLKTSSKVDSLAEKVDDLTELVELIYDQQCPIFQ